MSEYCRECFSVEDDLNEESLCWRCTPYKPKMNKPTWCISCGNGYGVPGSIALDSCEKCKPKMNKPETHCPQCGAVPMWISKDGVCKICQLDVPKMNKIERSKISVGDRFKLADRTWFVLNTAKHRTVIGEEHADMDIGNTLETDGEYFQGFDEYIPVVKEADMITTEEVKEWLDKRSRILYNQEVTLIANCTCGAKYVKDMTHSDWCSK